MKNYFGILGWAAQRKLSIHIYYFKIIFLFGQAFMCIKNQRASVGFAPWTQRVGLPTGVLKAGPWPGPHSRAWPNFTENYLKTSSWFQKGIYLSMVWHTHTPTLCSSFVWFENMWCDPANRVWCPKSVVDLQNKSYLHLLRYYLWKWSENTRIYLQW